MADQTESRVRVGRVPDHGLTIWWCEDRGDLRSDDCGEPVEVYEVSRDVWEAYHAARVAYSDAWEAMEHATENQEPTTT